jgi:primosomal protein N' (replication factor Y)
VAKKRAMAHNATLILGSATPSVISRFRADEGLYNLVELKERYNKVKMPVMAIVDMREELKQGNRSIFSNSLISHSQQCLAQGKQIILFLNRRGYANFVSCRECGYIMKCQHCGISLTYHRGKNLAVCHYCGHGETVPKTCPSCSSKYIKYFGVGTEKVEEIAKSTFHQAKVARLDLDTIKSRGSIDRILNDFKEGATQILVGTQLVAKGLDFENVGLVGIVAADISLNIPDYRSAERTFQLITQAAGRAGRGDSQGQVVIQSYTPDHYAIQGAANLDYSGFYKDELGIRRALGYPPFSDLIEVLFVSKEEELAKNQGKHSEEYLKKAIEEAFGLEELANLYPLAPSVLQRIGAAYRYHMLIRCPKNRRKEYTEILEGMKSEFVKSKKRDVSISIDINPYSFL